jgi:hypothetical protein
LTTEVHPRAEDGFSRWPVFEIAASGRPRRLHSGLVNGLDGAEPSASIQTVIDRFPPDAPVRLFAAKGGYGPKLETNAANGLQKFLDGSATKQGLNGQAEFALAFRLSRE